MKAKIFKYKFTTDPIELATDAVILSANMQYNGLFIWVKFYEDSPTRPRRFLMFGTGQDFDDSELVYISTVMDGAFVWHIFEDLHKY